MIERVDISSVTDSLFEWEGPIDEFLDGVLGSLQAAGDVLLGGRANPRGNPRAGEYVPPSPPRYPMRTDPARSTYRDANMPRTQQMSPDADQRSYYGRGNLGQAYDMRKADNDRAGYKPAELPISKMDTYHQDPREFQSRSNSGATDGPDVGGRTPTSDRQTHRYGHPTTDYGVPKPKPVIRQPQPPASAFDGYDN